MTVLPQKHWSLKSAIDQLARCDYECEAGKLQMNDAFIWLQAAVKIGPEFLPGQGVYYELKTSVDGVEMSAWKHYYIVGCRMDSDQETRFWRYDLSDDPPGPWHYGTVKHKNINGIDLSLHSAEEQQRIADAIEEEERREEANQQGQFGAGA